MNTTHVKLSPAVLLTFVLLLCNLSAIARPQEKIKKKEISQSYSVSAGDRLQVENRYGNITVTHWNQNQLNQLQYRNPKSRKKYGRKKKRNQRNKNQFQWKSPFQSLLQITCQIQNRNLQQVMHQRNNRWKPIGQQKNLLIQDGGTIRNRKSQVQADLIQQKNQHHSQKKMSLIQQDSRRLSFRKALTPNQNSQKSRISLCV